MYNNIKVPELIRGIKAWKNKKNKFNILMLHYTADPEKDPTIEGKEWVRNEMEGISKASWLKEYEIDFTTKSGQKVFGPQFCDFNPDIHYVLSRRIEEPFEYLISLDFGQNNPNAALIGIWKDSCLYIVDEYYRPAIPSVASRDMFEKFDYILNCKNLGVVAKRNKVYDIFQIRVIDPTTKAKNRVKAMGGEEIPYSVKEEFYDNGWDFDFGNNDTSAGITRIREYFKIEEDNQTSLYIFKDKCPNLCRELVNFRYKEYTERQSKSRNNSEEVVKKNDHTVDALKYLIMTRPYNPFIAPKPKTRIQKDIESLISPKILNNDWDLT